MTRHRQQLRGGRRMVGKPSGISLPDKPLVSIITVCLNNEKYLEQTIQSVINQTYDNIEYIIIDGGSIDTTLDIIRKYEEHIEYWVSEPDQGLFDAMNKGISLASGEWVGTINSDDFYAGDTVRLVVKASRKNREAQLFYGNLRILGSRECVDLRNYREHKGQADNLLKKMNCPQATWFVSREIYAKLKFNVNFKFAADWDFAVKLYLDNVKFGYVNKPLAYFRPGGMSGSLSGKRDAYRIETFYGTFLPFLTRTAMKKSLETGRVPLPFFLFFLLNTMQIFPVLHKILATTAKISLASINPQLTRKSAGRYRRKIHFLFFQLRYRLSQVFFYRYGLDNNS